MGEKLKGYLAEFEGLDPEERLELLVDFARELPALPPERHGLNQEGNCKINECQTPVYLDCEIRGGKLHFVADVPDKSPTVRGFVAMLVNGLEGEDPEEAAGLTPELLGRLGLNEVLGMTRVRGFAGILQRVRRLAMEECSGSGGDTGG